MDPVDRNLVGTAIALVSEIIYEQVAAAKVSQDWSDTVITAFVPASATTGPVTVTMNSVTSSGVQFTLTNPLSITALSSAAGTIGQSHRPARSDH